MMKEVLFCHIFRFYREEAVSRADHCAEQHEEVRRGGADHQGRLQVRLSLKKKKKTVKRFLEFRVFFLPPPTHTLKISQLNLSWPKQWCTSREPVFALGNFIPSFFFQGVWRELCPDVVGRGLHGHYRLLGPAPRILGLGGRTGRWYWLPTSVSDRIRYFFCLDLDPDPLW